MSEMVYILITNDPDGARLAFEAGVQRLMVDLENLGKKERQGHMDTFISGHKISDVAAVRKSVPDAELMVRINPVHGGTRDEIEQVLKTKIDLIMVPMFTSVQDIQTVCSFIDGRAGCVPLVETPQALDCLSDVCQVPGVSEVYLGLNDLHLALKNKFMFEPLLHGLVDQFAQVAKRYNLPFGFGGVAAIGTGDLPAELIVKEHARLGSTRVILSRSFQRHVMDDDEDLNMDSFKSAVGALSRVYRIGLRRNFSEVVHDQRRINQFIQLIIGGMA